MTRPPQSVGPPDFPERPRDLRRCDTDEISVEDLKRDAKRRASRRPKEIAAIGSAIAIIIAALAAGTVKVINALKEHDDLDSVQKYRMEQIEKRVDVHDSKLWECCRKE